MQKGSSKTHSNCSQEEQMTMSNQMIGTLHEPIWTQTEDLKLAEKSKKLIIIDQKNKLYLI
jgi:hypothetical protein